MTLIFYLMTVKDKSRNSNMHGYKEDKTLRAEIIKYQERSTEGSIWGKRMGSKYGEGKQDMWPSNLQEETWFMMPDLIF